MSGIEVAFFGALGRDAEAKTSKTSKTSKPYLRMNVRVGDGDGCQWISVLVFDAQATEQSDKFVNGARCYVECTLRLEQWTGQDGTKRHGLSVMSWHCRLAPKRKRKSAHDSRAQRRQPATISMMTRSRFERTK